ncbi:MAG TPA: hypothetical protein PK054_07750 [Anaerohalosphaeraceae bacterium]|nr:hypothetical protein [Anaerohalosphaeraceae bacterium]HOL89011.1 hypothetical protein [Anaerohalosphaeraceae bacterium]HPP56462.1 hypothetical protein [Anaerohalosphaeraceae bacterium]
MKYLALLRKEIRECLPWVLLAAGILFIFGFQIVIQPTTFPYYPDDEAKEEIDPFYLFRWSSLSGAGSILLFLSLCLGAAFSIRQFWFPSFTRTWTFLLHRNITRTAVFFVKITAAVLGFALSLLSLWTLLFLYSVFAVDYSPPPMPHVWLEGLFLISQGLVVYFASSLSSVLTAKWYTTRLFPVIFVFMSLYFCFYPKTPALNFLCTGLSMLILALPLWQEFRNRQF